MIAIVDTGGANLASVVNAFARMGVQSEITSDKEKIWKAERVILPGVGAALDSMNRLNQSSLVSFIRELQQPVMGICLGMQLLFERSDEGNANCLGILPGNVTRFSDTSGFPVPHMGWNQLRTESASPLLKDIPEGSYFYFVHSYIVPNGEWVTATCDYGVNFPACVQHKNFFGVQFHPEKSAAAGEKLLRNFLAL